MLPVLTVSRLLAPIVLPGKQGVGATGVQALARGFVEGSGVHHPPRGQWVDHHLDFSRRTTGRWRRARRGLYGQVRGISVWGQQRPVWAW